MNDMVHFEISRFTLLEMFFLGVVLFVVLRLVRRLIHRLVLPGSAGLGARALRRQLRRFWPLIETIIWTLFALNAIASIFQNHLYYTGALMIVLLVGTAGFSWFVLKDWFAGVILRIRDVYHPNQMIRIGDIRGTVRRLGDLTLEIEQEDGEIAEIPYSQANSQIHWKSSTERSAVTAHRFEVQIARNGAPLAEARDTLRAAILLSPWLPSRKIPQIHLLEETPEHFRFEVKIAAPDRQIARAVEADVRNRIK